MKFSTRTIHNQGCDRQTGAVIPPINVSTNFVFKAPGETMGGYDYTRAGNPNRNELESVVAALENGKHGLAFASGMAATAAMLWLVRPREHIVLTSGCYGGTHRIVENFGERYEIEYDIINTSDLDAARGALRANTRLVLIETPTNPLLWVSDIAALADMAHQSGALLAVDNTFLSPYFQRPLDLGADIVMHSATKYIGGHSDILGGILVARDDEIAADLRTAQIAAGAAPSPQDCWLTLRSLKTLELRMKQHNANALATAEYLTRHPKVDKVFFEGLPDHPHYELARRQQTDPYGAPGYAGMVSFTIKDAARIEPMLNAFSLFIVAESLGGVESLICHPASMTHASISEEARRRFGIADSLVRLSVGVEHIDDLLSDLETALAAV